ncbi:MAG: radical SAM protein [Deltaproteobacteria bacterium]|nr:radical SAM protein [Deltaproteobacteria bacterium]
MARPSYLKLFEENELSKRVEKALSLLESCHLCPRKCGVNRLEGETGVCGTGRNAKAAGFNAHFGEEAPLVGRFGSGTVFISSCNLLCSFCQNYEISHFGEGIEVRPEQMADMMIQLSVKGCHNINFVTPTHVVPQILEALIPAVKKGLRLPLIYNSSGYDSKETLELLDGIFDIYMPDFKFWDAEWAKRYCKAPDYRQAAIEAIKEMHRQVGDLVIDDGIAVRGLLVRHLVMPNNVAGTVNIMKFLAKDISTNTYVNVMDQYRPCGKADKDDFIKRRLTSKEYGDAVNAAKDAGLTRLDSRKRTRLIAAVQQGQELTETPDM